MVELVFAYCCLLLVEWMTKRFLTRKLYGTAVGFTHIQLSTNTIFRFWGAKNLRHIVPQHQPPSHQGQPGSQTYNLYSTGKARSSTKVNEYGQYGHEIDPKQTELHRIFCKKQPPWYHMTRKYAQCIQDITRW